MRDSTDKTRQAPVRIVAFWSASNYNCETWRKDRPNTSEKLRAQPNFQLPDLHFGSMEIKFVNGSL